MSPELIALVKQKKHRDQITRSLQEFVARPTILAAPFSPETVVRGRRAPKASTLAMRAEVLEAMWKNGEVWMLFVPERLRQAIHSTCPDHLYVPPGTDPVEVLKALEAQ